MNAATSTFAATDVYSRASQILEPFKEMRKSVGSDLWDVVHVNVILKAMGGFVEMNRAYIEMMGVHRAAHTVVGVNESPKPRLVLTMNLTAEARN